jgi:hypothetical protein
MLGHGSISYLPGNFHCKIFNLKVKYIFLLPPACGPGTIFPICLILVVLADLASGEPEVTVAAHF